MTGSEIAFFLLFLIAGMIVIGLLDVLVRPPGWQRFDDRTYERPDGYTVYRCDDGTWVILANHRLTGELAKNYDNPITAMHAVEKDEPYQGDGPMVLR